MTRQLIMIATVALCGAASVVLASPVGSDIAGTQRDDVIVPGERVGPVRLNMSEGEVYSLGLLIEGGEIEPVYFKRYPHLEVYFSFKSAEGNLPMGYRVTRIIVRGGLYGTKDNIRVGKSSKADVLAAYGQRPVDRMLNAIGYPGIEFWFMNDVVSSISVRPQNEHPLSN